MKEIITLGTLLLLALFLVPEVDNADIQAAPTYVFITVENENCPSGWEGWCEDNPWFIDCQGVGGGS